MNNFESKLVGQMFHQYVQRGKIPPCSRKTSACPYLKGLSSLKKGSSLENTKQISYNKYKLTNH
jgi:hypothetical protein